MEQRPNKAYLELVKKLTPTSPCAKNLFHAFWVGGLLCALGEGVSIVGREVLWLSKEDGAAFVAIVMVFLGVFLTALGLYDRIGKIAGAGSVVPITGFANAVAASAMEARREGLVTGVGAKLFTVAGPVLVYGIGASVLAGLLSHALRGILP